MSEALLTQCTVKRVIGDSRLQRLVRAGWLAPVERTPSRVLFRARDVHAALRLLERRFCPPDQIKVAKVRASEKRHGRAYRKKVCPAHSPRGLNEIVIDFSAFESLTDGDGTSGPDIQIGASAD